MGLDLSISENLNLLYLSLQTTPYNLLTILVDSHLVYL